MDPRLKAIYDELPEVPCTGACFECCSLIGTFPVERQAMLAAGKVPMEITEEPCPWLTLNGRCSAHAVRPLICRIYGATPELSCPHGCEPERWLTKAESRRYMERVAALLKPTHLDPAPRETDRSTPFGRALAAAYYRRSEHGG